MRLGFGLGFPRKQSSSSIGTAIDLLFAGATTLDPRITFSRTTNATVVGANGQLQYAPHNLLTYSEQLDNAAWVKSNATVSPNTVAAPDGTTSADKLVEDTTAAVSHFIQVGITSQAGIPYAGSVYVKAAERRYIAVTMTGGGGADRGAFFDGQTGAYTGGFAGGLPYTVTSVGNGWFRYTLTDTTTAAAGYAIRVYVCDVANNILYTGDGTSGLYVWGAQINVGAIQPYYSTTVKNTLGYTQEFDNAAWVKTNASVATNLLTYSEQFDNAAWTKSNSVVQTNQIRNNTAQGAVAGTPGTLPTNWGLGGISTGLSSQIVGTGSEDGINYIDIRIFGTNSSGTAAFPGVFFDTTTAIAGTTGQVWAESLYLTLVAGTAPSFDVSLHEADSGGVFLRSSTMVGATGVPITGTLKSQRRSGSTTLGASTAFIRPVIATNIANGATIDFTLRIGLPQLVQGAVAGDVVQTYGTARALMYSAPDATTSADKVVEDTINGQHVLFRSTSIVANTPYAASGYFKAGERTRINFRLLNGTFNSGANVTFDLSAGTVPFSAIVGTATNLLFSITPVGNGWYRCSASCVVDATSTSAVWAAYLVNTGNNDTYLGDGTSGIYVWGAQLVQSGAAETYQRTEATIRPIGYTAPDGSTTAEKFIPDTVSTDHKITQSTVSVVLGAISTFSVYVKAAGYNFVRLSFGSTAGGGYTFFNVSNGTIGTTSSMLSNKIQSMGNGWYRCTVTREASAAGNLNAGIYVTSADSEFTWAGNGTNGIALWGAQVSPSASLDAYKYNPGAAPTAAAYYGPRLDYDPVTLAAKGLLIEEQRTNSIRNNTMQGAVAGTPGTAPTNWSASFNTTTGITRSIVGTGTEDGITYIDISLVGTASGAGSVDFAFETANGIAAATGQIWGTSLYWKIAAGSLTGLSNPIFYTYEYDSSTGFVNAPNSGSPSLPTTAPLRTQRFKGAATLSGGATTAFIRPLVKINIADGAAIDITLRIGMPQLEQGAFATSVIPTTTATATRATDVASVTGANFSGWYNAVEGTLFAEFGPYGNGGATKNLGIVNMDDGTSSNIIRLFAGSTISPVFAVTSSTVTQAYLSSEVIAPTNISKIAGSYKTDNFARSVNGTATTTDSIGTVPVVNRLLIASGTSGVNELNGHIRSFKYFPRRLSNAELQAITA